MAEIRPVDPGTFVGAAEAAARLRREARKIQGREERKRDQHPFEDPDETVEPGDEDLDPGAYDDHGRRGKVIRLDHPDVPETHVDRLA